MNLKGLISITGKPGLYRVVSQGKNTLIVESLNDGKRFPAFASDKVSALEDISMYTTEEDIPLGEVIAKIHEKENGGPTIDSKSDASEQHKYFETILPNYDKERVHNSDLRKLFAWYNILQSTGTLTKIIEDTKALEAAIAEAEAKQKADSKKEKSSAKAKAEDKEEKAEDKTEKKAKPKAKTAATQEKKTTIAAKKTKTESKAKTTTRKSTTTKRGA